MTAPDSELACHVRALRMAAPLDGHVGFASLIPQLHPRDMVERNGFEMVGIGL